MRVLTAGAVLITTAALGVGATASADAAVRTDRAATFTPPIGTNHGSVVAPAIAKGPNGFELNLEW